LKRKSKDLDVQKLNLAVTLATLSVIMVLFATQQEVPRILLLCWMPLCWLLWYRYTRRLWTT